MKKWLIWLLIVWWVVWYWMYKSWVTFDDVSKFDLKTIEQKVNNKVDETKDNIITIENASWDKIVEIKETWPAWDIKWLESIYWSYNWISWKSFTFSQAKKNLENKIYDTKEDRIDNYCWTEYNEDKSIDQSNTWFKSNSKSMTRAERIEWEHVVPAENFWKAFKEWREWNPELCWEWVKWRKCAARNETFAKMEWDIYNLIPANWEVNWLRSNINFWMVTSNTYKSFWSCNFKVDTVNNVAEPTDQAKWQVARISMYFALKYKDYYKISDQQLKLFQAWNKQFPPTKYECKINREKANLVWYKNLVVENECVKVWL